MATGLFTAIVAIIFVINSFALMSAHATEVLVDANGNSVVAPATKVEIPVINVSKLNGGSLEERKAVAMQIKAACEDVGFFVIKGHGVPDSIVDNMWSTTREFFDQDTEFKLTYTRPQEEYPFGYSVMGGEVLSAGKSQEQQKKDESLPDLKEMFSLGPGDPAAGFPPRVFPERCPGFEAAWTAYYEEVNRLAQRLLSAFALALNQSEDFFLQFTDHHASALRALNYPDLGSLQQQPGQLRASAHTDYGTLTILRADGPGLQVSKDKDPPSWNNVPYYEGAFIINLGDMMKRWTNDKWLSTLHRVITPEQDESGGLVFGRRQSVAFFHNLNRDALVSNLIADEPAKYEPVVAGDFLMQKHLAAVGAKK